jgi:hypothetical protein
MIKSQSEYEHSAFLPEASLEALRDLHAGRITDSQIIHLPNLEDAGKIERINMPDMIIFRVTPGGFSLLSEIG